MLKPAMFPGDWHLLTWHQVLATPPSPGQQVVSKDISAEEIVLTMGLTMSLPFIVNILSALWQTWIETIEDTTQC